jgi:hypothetical protein
VNTAKQIWLSIAVLLAILVVWRFPERNARAADSVRFDYVYVISPVYLYQGRQGILLMDKRNGKVWFIAKGDEVNISFRDPVFVVRIPLEKLESAP